jgi:hypothetical protein
MDSNTAAAVMDEIHALIPGLPNAPRHEVFTRLRQELPVFKIEKIGVRVAARYTDVIAVTTQDELFQPPQAGLGSPAYGRTFLRMNGREHSKKIGIVGREMRSARALRDRLDGIVLRRRRTHPTRRDRVQPDISAGRRCRDHGTRADQHVAPSRAQPCRMGMAARQLP